ncbi:MAG TPA: secretin N-terminal domain-containing protein [Syntrophales bacterium]|nr:secretin N-terminal domain-containing protein [Syntrophales bacterium]
MVSLNFDDADVYSIIQTIFGDVLRVNYVVDPRVKGRVTFRSVAPVPNENVLPIMEVIFRLNGIGIIEENGLYRIIPISEISKEPSPVRHGKDPASVTITGKSILQVIPIQYVQSTEVIRLIQPFMSANAVIVDVPKGNLVIIADTDANVKRLLQLIQIFDSEQLKRRPQVYVHAVQNGKAKEIATLLQQIFLGSRSTTTAPGGAATTPARPATPSTPGAPSAPTPTPSPGLPGSAASSGDYLISESTKIIPDEVTNTIIIMATPEDFAVIKKTIEGIDIIPRQVVIEGMIASVNLTDNLSLGLSAIFKGSIGGLDVTWGINPGSTSGVNPASLSSSGFTFVGTDSAGAIRAYITAQATDSRAKVLAAPHILVSDNREARIQVGQQVPIVTSETIATSSVPAQRTIQYRDIGVILKVKPRINEGGLVSLDLTQEVSTFSTIKLYVDSTEIILNKTETTTNLVVQDGQTIVIGGLIREDTSRSRTGVPFLSKVPILGWLFGSTEDDKSRAELIILLTPYVVKDQKAARDMTSDFIDRMSESSQGRIQKDELLKGKDIAPRTPAPAEAQPK